MCWPEMHKETAPDADPSVSSDTSRPLHGGLTGGISGADQRHLLAAAQLGLQRRCPVADFERPADGSGLRWR
jgi:hypothetical protein